MRMCHYLLLTMQNDIHPTLERSGGISVKRAISNKFKGVVIVEDLVVLLEVASPESLLEE